MMEIKYVTAYGASGVHRVKDLDALLLWMKERRFQVFVVELYRI